MTNLTVSTAVAAVSLFWTQLAHPADADFWKTHVGMEIQRGEDASGECAGRVLHADAFNACVASVQERNSKKGGDTAAFDAGFYFDVWLTMALMADPDDVPDVDIMKQAQIDYKPLARRFFKLYRDGQKKLGIPDDRFLVASHFDDTKPIKARVAAADAAR